MSLLFNTPSRFVIDFLPRNMLLLISWLQSPSVVILEPKKKEKKQMDVCWAVKKAEHQRIDDFKLWCWRRLLRVPWTARRSNQSILKEVSPEFTGRTHAEAEAPVFWPPDAKSQLIGKDPDVGKD